MFTSVHNHTECSNLRFSDCTIKVESLLDRAIELGYNGVCITDHEALSGHARFLQHYKALQDAGKLPEGFRIGLGNEVYLVDRDAVYDAEGNPQKTQFYHLILIAKDIKGHEQLRAISSRAWESYFRQGPAERVPTFKDDLKRIVGDEKGHLIVSTACLGGELAVLALEYEKTKDKNIKKKIVDFLLFLIDVFGKDSVFLELQPRMHTDGQEPHDQVLVNRCLVRIAKAMGLPYIVTTDSHYLVKEDRYVHEAFLNSDPTNHGDRELGDFYETTYMMGEDEVLDFLESHLSPEEAQAAIGNTQRVWEMLTDYDLSHSVIVPADKHIPSQIELRGLFDTYPQYEYIQKFRCSEDAQERYLLHLIEEGFIEKNQEFNETNLARIDEELGTIWEISARLDQRLAHYYVLVRELIHKVMWPVSYVGVARGSVTGFYICYLSGITQLNPIEYDLPDWRHLHTSRPELPDIDVDTSASKRPQIFQRMKEYYGADNVLNTLAFKTLAPKSAILAACRGLGINDDTAHMLAGYVPVERGMAWSLTECFYGNEEKGRAPIQAFINEVHNYDQVNLKETMLELEGLICGRSIHASACYVFEEGYLKQNSLMRAPNGTLCTAFNMGDSDFLGGLKMDCLTIKGLDKLQMAMALLIEAGVIEDQGSLKATYDKYLHPDVLDYEAPEMWKMLADGIVNDVFQFDTPVGRQAGQKIRPSSVVEMAAANSLMRLMAPDGEDSPIDVYVRHKNDIGLWYEEMREYGLSEAEVKVMADHLLVGYGVAATQEEMMQLVMDERISGFTMTEANKLRKGVGKKKPKLIEECKKMFFEKAKELGTSDALAHYVWDVQIHRQEGYSFSVCHTTPYSVIGLQEMNLAYRYGPIYWSTACLTVNAGADADTSGEVTDYDKIAVAIGDLAGHGQQVSPPLINKARFNFWPDPTTNEIIFSLKAIRGLGDAQADCIVRNQPFSSFEDFLERTQEEVKPSSVIALIKAGAFDEFEPAREDLMRRYLAALAPTIKKLTTKNIPELIRSGAVAAESCRYERTCIAYSEYVKKNGLAVKGNTAGTTWYYTRGKHMTDTFFDRNLASGLREGVDFKFHEDGYQIVKGSALDRAIKKQLEGFKQKILSSSEALEKVNEARIEAFITEKCPGGISAWEMEVLGFYVGPHELKGINTEVYGIVNFNDLPKEPIKDTVTYGNRVYQSRKMYNLAGTVIARNKDRHTVTILTLDGVVNLKFYRESFIHYNQRLSETDADGNKHVIETSWFQRGNKLLVHGFRQEDIFSIRQEKRGGVIIPAVSLITDMDEYGCLKLKRHREREEPIVA